MLRERGGGPRTRRRVARPGHKRLRLAIFGKFPDLAKFEPKEETRGFSWILSRNTPFSSRLLRDIDRIE